MNNLSKYSTYLADNIFCNDRSISTDKTSGFSNLGYGAEETAYRWFYGPWSNDSYNSSMKLTCPQQNDAFTVSDTTNGNGALTYPIGLITTDEIVLAGGWNADNNDFYLYSGSFYWASSPFGFGGSFATMMGASSSDNKSIIRPTEDYYGGVRPVSNLSLDVLNNGDGSMNNPYQP